MTKSSQSSFEIQAFQGNVRSKFAAGKKQIIVNNVEKENGDCEACSERQ